MGFLVKSGKSSLLMTPSKRSRSIVNKNPAIVTIGDQLNGMFRTKPILLLVRNNISVQRQVF